MWVCLNDFGKQVWEDVFPDDKVPVCSSDFQETVLEGAGKEQVILVNWRVLSSKQQSAILAKISERFGASKDDVLANILKAGLPLRKSYTSGVVAIELRFFI